jgi:hypothetical protein
MRRLLGHKWLEPVGFLVLSPAMAGIFGRMRIGGSSTKAHTAEGGVCLLARPLFGSGSAGLGSLFFLLRWREHLGGCGSADHP